MKRSFYLLIALLYVVMEVTTVTAQTTTCSNATLNGKYAVSGQGDVYSCLLGVVCTDQTMSTVGYFWFDGNGNIASPTSGAGVGQAGARLFQATNAGVSSAMYTGTYTVSSDCSSGGIQLTSANSTQTLTYNLDPDGIDTNGLSHGAAALDAGQGRDEALQLSRTVDPVGGCGVNGTFTLAGIAIRGLSLGTDISGNKVSNMVEIIFTDSANFSGSERVSTVDRGFSSNTYTGTYIIASDCTVSLTKNVNGTEIQGAHVITGDDFGSFDVHSIVWQGDSILPNARFLRTHALPDARNEY